MTSARILLAAAVLTLAGTAQSAKILGVIPSGGKSHHFVGAAYTKALAEAGHDVTVIAAFREKNPPKNYREIVMDDLYETLLKFMENPFEFPEIPPLMHLYMMYTEFGKFSSEFTLNHPEVKELMKSGETFDLVIVETFLTEAIYGMAQHFNASLITYSTLGNILWTRELTRSPAPTSHVANFILNYVDSMTFWERVWNTIVDWSDRLMYNTLHLPVQKQLYEQAFPNAKISFEEQMKNVSLVLLNSHFSLSSPRPYPPNVIEAGGIQIEKVKPLPEDLQKFLDGAKDGAIYFSMGSYLKSNEFPIEKRDAFIKVFSRMKQRIVWKFEDESITNLPKNVLIKPWMPQNDILAHPNVKVFMTHGGLLGGTEALFHGKPVVGIPIFGDQTMNVQRAVKTGYGVELLYKDITEENVENALNKVLGDPKYAKTAQLISQRYHDKPMSAKETALFWIEYVLRHRGAPQLRSPALELSFFQYLALDVYGTLVAIVLAVNLMLYWAVKSFLRNLCGTKPKKSKKVD
ncbi:hypothetical protein pipiens_004019 [Culex pipiens pipiens]|uniref:UDP-glucuronosyltransferase n=1 Tax=Culex pipiens pipiens TaxID=38569 RepID=A0ABD1CPG4_CULPP